MPSPAYDRAVREAAVHHATSQRPVGWTSQQWLDALHDRARRSGLEVHVSFLHRDPPRLERRKLLPHRDIWQSVSS